MSKYIDAEKLKTEIDKRMDENCKLGEKAECFIYQAVEDNDILAIIDSLQQAEMDLDEEIDRFLKSEESTAYENAGSYKVAVKDPRKIAKHFFELGQSTMRKRFTNPEYNREVVEKMKSDYPMDESNARKEE